MDARYVAALLGLAVGIAGTATLLLSRTSEPAPEKEPARLVARVGQVPITSAQLSAALRKQRRGPATAGDVAATLEKLIEFQIENGTDAIVPSPTGSTTRWWSSSSRR